MYNSLYDPHRYDSKDSPSIRGGKSRAMTADRDLQGRFMPKDLYAIYAWLLDPEHGKRGGNVRAKTGKRMRGKFCG